MSRALISLQRLFEQDQCCQYSSSSGIMISLSELEVPGDELCTVPCMGATLTMINKVATKVVRPSS